MPAISGTEPVIRPVEAELVRGCIRNRRASQKALYERYCDAMYSTAYRILGSREEAMDALQDAFIQVFRDIASFRGESTIGAWIKTIVVRSALKKIRNSVSYVPIEENVHDIALDIPPGISGEYLEKAILSLPDGYRTVFLLIEVEGYSHQEVAGMMGISAGTSKSQLHHAKKQLKRMITSINGYHP